MRVCLFIWDGVKETKAKLNLTTFHLYVCVCMVCGVCGMCFISHAASVQYSSQSGAWTRREASDHSAWALPPSPYGHRIPLLPPQASVGVKTNCVECVGIKYPIILRRHAIKELQPSLAVDIM